MSIHGKVGALKEARERLSKLATDIRAVTEVAVKEERGLNADERQNWNKPSGSL